jgi:DNA-directed RNA polymerase subunit RPC12/RpoP
MAKNTSKIYESFIEKRVTTEETYYYCKYCSFSCDSIKLIESHLSEHQIKVKNKPKTDENINKNNHSDNYEENNVKRSSETNTTYFCTQCKREFKSETDLRKHKHQCSLS